MCILRVVDVAKSKSKGRFGSQEPQVHYWWNGGMN
jgi:hypothetical protein